MSARPENETTTIYTIEHLFKLIDDDDVDALAVALNEQHIYNRSRFRNGKRHFIL